LEQSSFDDEEGLVGKIKENSLRNTFLISKPKKIELPLAQKFSYPITLRDNSNRLLNFIPLSSSYRLFQELATSSIAI